MPDAIPLTIIDTAGQAHVFPAGFDPQRAQAIVAQQSDPVVAAGRDMAPDPTTVVTLGDLINSPAAAFKQMGQIVKKDVHDPKVMLPILAGAAIGVGARLRGGGPEIGATAPNAFAEAHGPMNEPGPPGGPPGGPGGPPPPPPPGGPSGMPTPPPRPGLFQTLRNRVTLGDIVDAVPGYKTAKGIYNLSSKVAGAVQDVRGAAAPPAPPPTAVPVPAPTPVASPAPPEMPVPSAPSAPAPAPPAAPPAARVAYDAAQAAQARAAAPPAPPAAPAPPPEPPFDAAANRLANARADQEMLNNFRAKLAREAAARAAGQPAAAPAATPRPAPAPAPRPTARPAAAPAARPVAGVEVPASLEALQLTPAEIAQGVKWHAQGITPAKIVERILMARKLTAGTGAPTPDEMTAAIKVRNETGKWPGEGSGKP